MSPGETGLRPVAEKACSLQTGREWRLFTAMLSTAQTQRPEAGDPSDVLVISMRVI